MTHEDLARRLHLAYRRGATPSLRDHLAPDDVAGAYRVQSINTERWRGDGRRIVGRKIGLTSAVVQAQFGVDQPDFGVLFDDMRIADGGRLDPARVLQPRAEAEIALILARDLFETGAQPADVLAAADRACAAIEIVDSRIADWNITLADTIADNGSSAFFVLGETREALVGLDLSGCGMTLEINGGVVSTGKGANCLGHPLEAAAWLARTLAREGAPLRAGDILLTGALGPVAALTPGDRVEARIDGLGRVGFTYGEPRS